MKNFKKGIYRHYKSYLYEVIDVAKHTETLQDMVVYKSLYGNFEMWVRPFTMFFEDVEINGKMQKRFEFIDEGKADIK